MKKSLVIFICLFLVTTAIYLPILVNPNILLARGNDLEEFFWPIIYFIKNQIVQNHTLPLWNTLFLSGTPLLPDPQSPLFYLPNLIFLFTSIDKGFILIFFLHSLAGGLGVYLCTRKAFNLSRLAGLFSASLYITTPKLSGYLIAGHFGLICFLAWIPLVVLSIIKLAQETKIRWSILLGSSLAILFYCHVLSFIIALSFSIIFFVICFIINKKRDNRGLFLFLLGLLIVFGLTAITLLPQLDWQKETTRYLLLKDKDIYPKWDSKFEFLEMVFYPWNKINNNLGNIDPEKWISLGIFPSLFALWGFIKLKRVYKIIVIITTIPLLLIILNNASPIYFFLLNQNWYSLLRVSTRFWFLFILINVFLAGFAYDKLTKSKAKIGYISLIALLAILEPLFLNWTYYKKPIVNNNNLAPKEVYDYLSQDKSLFRVFCLNRCLSQKEAAIYHLELADGYSTLQQTNYYQYFMQIAQSYWNKYTLTLPPFDVYLFEKLQPWEPVLSDANIKYIISDHLLKSPTLKMEVKIGDYYIYSNPKVLSRAYFLTNSQAVDAKISLYSPNKIIIETQNKSSQKIVISQIFNSSWSAYLDGKEKTIISPWNNIFLEVEIKPETKYLLLKYEPFNYKIGEIITLVTIMTIILSLIFKKYLKFLRGIINK